MNFLDKPISCSISIGVGPLVTSIHTLFKNCVFMIIIPTIDVRHLFILKRASWKEIDLTLPKFQKLEPCTHII
jgi:hypothetical protein